MKIWINRIVWLLPLFVLLSVGWLHWMVMQFQPSDEEVQACFKDCASVVQYQNFTVGVRSLHYVEIGDPSQPLLLFIPGSPGTWDNFMEYLADAELLDRFRMIAVDRLGMGLSRAGGAEASLEKQAAALWPLLKKETLPVVVAGHSYGGAVAARLAMDHPEKLEKLILIAASVSPEHEERRWYNYFADWKVVSWMLPKNLVMSNREMKPLKEELEAMRSGWESLQIPVTILHGEKDPLVPYAHALFARDVLTRASVTMEVDPEWNHFIPWNQFSALKQSLLQSR